MGYYTHYHLEIKKKSELRGFYEPMESDIKEIRRVFTEILGSHNSFYEFDELLDATVEWKWYDHEKDMRELALAFPDIYFTLSGAGEERDDYWIKQFHGSEVYSDYAEIIEPKRKW